MNATISNLIHVCEGDDLDIIDRRLLPYKHNETLGVGGYVLEIKDHYRSHVMII